MIVVNVNKYDRKPAFRSKIRVKRFQVRLPFEFLTLTFCLNHFDLSIFQFSKHVCSTFGRFGNVFNTNGFTIKIHFFHLCLKLVKMTCLTFLIRVPFGFCCFQTLSTNFKVVNLPLFSVKNPKKNCRSLLKFFSLFFCFFFSFFFDMKVVCFDF